MARYHAKTVARVVADALRRDNFVAGERFNPEDQEGPLYNVAGCPCGCAPNFQMYYLRKVLAVIPFEEYGRNRMTPDRKGRVRRRIRRRLPELRELDILSEEDKKYPGYLESLWDDTILRASVRTPVFS